MVAEKDSVYMGNLLRVDLTNNKVTTEILDPEVVRKYIGGQFVIYITYLSTLSGLRSWVPKQREDIIMNKENEV